MRRLISLGIGLTVTAAVACSGVGTSTENIDATVRAAVAATQEAQPTAIPEYTPDLTDYLVALRENGVQQRTIAYSTFLDRFDDYAMVYLFAERLTGERPTPEGFRSFVAANLGNNPRLIALKQLPEIQTLAAEATAPEWMIALADPDSAADSVVTCRMAEAAWRATYSSLVNDSFSFPECHVLFAEYMASGASEAKTYLDYLDEQGYW